MGPVSEFTFGGFVQYFRRAEEDGRLFRTLNTRGEESDVTFHKGTFDNVLRNLDPAVVFFDNPDSVSLDERDILVKGKVSVINVAGGNSTQFGAVLLRDLLHRIVLAKQLQQSNVPVLIIIDEVHQFYSSESALGALGDIDTICRTGRSQEIGVIFSSQNPSDLPKGLSNVINTKIFFKSDPGTAKTYGLRISEEEMESLRKGYSVCNIHDLSLLRVAKFPMSFAGVFEVEKR
jgi:DNA helicase HerA-like ATPase